MAGYSSFVSSKIEGALADNEADGALVFQYLPAYAAYLLQNSVGELVTRQLRMVRELNVPIFKYFANMPEDVLVERSMISMELLLRALAENKAAEYISQSLRKWAEDQLPMISRDKILAEDITLISFIRRSVFRSMLPKYSNDAELSISILNEVDSFTTKVDTHSFKILISIQQELYHQTQELAQIGNWFWDLVKDKITWSNEIFNIYGLVPQHDITYNLAAYNHPDDAAAIQQQMARSRETLQPHDFYYRIVLQGNVEKVLHAKGRVLTDDSGKAYRMFGTLQDVTAQKRLENEVIEKQTLIQKIADLTPSMIAAYNINSGKYLFINRAIESILGYRQEDVLEKGVAFFIALVHPDDLQGLIQENTDALLKANTAGGREQDTITEFLYRLKHADGGYRWMQTYGTIFTRNRNGEVEEVINISIDVTGQVATAHELKAKHEELELKNKELESFTYIASHDLQEPLRKIKFFVQQVQPLQAVQPGQTDYYSRISAEATRMQLMVNGLLEYSTMARDERAFLPVSLNDVIADVQADLAETLAEKSGIIETGPLPVVSGMPLQMHQLFVNLVSNALKYSRDGVAPHINITAELLTNQHTLPGTANAYKITFADNGIGFEEKYAQHIFELFRRLHTKTAYPGTGVGLTICKRIVENHNGAIYAEGTPGKGATFYIYLPAE